jgi:hypothetical protein
MATRKPIQKQAEKKAEPVKQVKKEVVEPVKRSKSVKAMDFVGIWQKGECVADVAEHFNRNEQWASGFASRLRKMGVNLKKMPKTGGGGGGKKLDIDELNALIEE